MIQHAVSEAPLECCGLMTGRQRTINSIHKCTNELRSKESFHIPAEELFDFFRHIRGSENEFLGIFHSHPSTPAIPSRKDKDEFHYPDVSYWIVSLFHDLPVVRCFRMSRGEFLEMEYHVIR